MKNFVTFDNAKEMLDFINDGHDLYCEEDGTFVTNYNCYNSIVVYDLEEFRVRKCEKYREETGGYWLECLNDDGVDDGVIYDDPSYPYFEKDQISNIDFCKQNYKDIWLVIC